MDRLAAIEIFIRVVDTGSFSAAARHFDIGQPAVSKTVAQLEEWVGVKLLRRSFSRGSEISFICARAVPSKKPTRPCSLREAPRRD